MASKRTDCHRPGAIVPADYSYRCSYDMGGMNEPPFGIDDARKLCEGVGWMNRGMMFGHMGKCGVCGALFRYGDIWEHVPTGALVHLGHDCADKYELLADRADFDAERAAAIRARLARETAEFNAKRMVDYLADKPELAAALETDHAISKDLKNKLRAYGDLSPKQIALALKLAGEAKEAASRPVEVNVPAPTGKLTVRGVVVSKKVHEGAYGDTLKMTVKVTTDAGVWLAWGTVPAGLLVWSGWATRNKDGSICEMSDDYCTGVEVGDTVEFTATLKPGREAHFALFSRPTKARIVERKNPIVAVGPKDPPEPDAFAAFEKAV